MPQMERLRYRRMIEKIDKTVEDMVNITKWQSYTGGMIEGALKILFSISSLSKEERVTYLSDAIGLSRISATEYIEEFGGRYKDGT